MKNHGHDPENQAQWQALDTLGIPWHVAADDWLLAIDDTDNLTSRGTGFLARKLAVQLAEQGIAIIKGITRHQLLVDPRIPYTSHNSSACLVLTSVAAPQAVFDYTCAYLLRESAEGSDAGTVLIQRSAMPEEIRAFGREAKVSVLTQADAKTIAARHQIPMAGLTGTGGGIIGALAATGLNASGHDGRFLWVKELRSMAGQSLSVGELEQSTGVHIQDIANEASTFFAKDEQVDLGEWPRAVFLNQRPTLLVEKNNGTNTNGWRTAPKNFVKQF